MVAKLYVLIDDPIAYIMMKKTLIFGFILLIIGNTPLKAQYFALKSMEGQTARIHLYYDTLNRQFTASCPGDTLVLEEYFGAHQARILGARFLEITYAVRGGSGLGLANTLLLAVKGHRLCQALLINSHVESVNLHYHYLYNSSLRFTRNPGDKYDLTVSAREYTRDKKHPSGVRIEHKPVVLHFDQTRVAFLKRTAVADLAFTGSDYNHFCHKIKFVAGDTLALVKVADERYYFAEGSWYIPITRRYVQEDTVVQKIFDLPVVQTKNAWVDSVTGHRHGMSVWVLKTTDWPSDTGYYVLQAGYFSGVTLDPFYQFKVYQPDLRISEIP
jgi:hypothetical protein